MRVPLSNQKSTPIIRTTLHIVGFLMQNLSATVDIYFSDDERQLDVIDPATGIPKAGFKLTGTASNPLNVIPWPFQGKLFARAAGIGAQNPPVELEVMPFYGEDPPMFEHQGPYKNSPPVLKRTDHNEIRGL